MHLIASLQGMPLAAMQLTRVLLLTSSALWHSDAKEGKNCRPFSSSVDMDIQQFQFVLYMYKSNSGIWSARMYQVEGPQEIGDPDLT